MHKATTLLIVTILLTSLMPLQAQVWVPENQWTLEWEKEFARFVEGNYHFYRKGGGAEKYLSMRTNGRGEVGCYLDCTNLLYASRAIFAFENKLPFMTRLAGYLKKENKFFDWGDIGHFTTSFNGHSAGVPRFRAFLTSLLNTAFSCTLNDDTFPVAVRPDVLLPGMVYSINPELSNGHSYLIFRIEPGPDITNKARKPVMVLGGTIPANIPLPEYYFFKQQGRLRWEGYIHHRRGGLRAWLIPVRGNDGHWELQVPEYGRDWYSAEQFEKKFLMIQRIVDERFMVPDLTPEEELQAGVYAISWSFVKRVNIISDGHRKWVALGRPAVLSEKTLDDLGTIHTDRRIAFSIREVFSSQLTDEQKDAILDQFVFDYTGSGDYLTFKQIFRAFVSNSVSSTPVDPFHVRWGLAPDEKPMKADEIAGRIILPDDSFPPSGGWDRDYSLLTPEVNTAESDPKQNQDRKNSTIDKPEVKKSSPPVKTLAPEMRRGFNRFSTQPAGSKANRRNQKQTEETKDRKLAEPDSSTAVQSEIMFPRNYAPLQSRQPVPIAEPVTPAAESSSSPLTVIRLGDPPPETVTRTDDE